MKKTSFKRILRLLLIIISISGILLTSKFNIFKKDYTENYNLYKGIKDYSTLTDIKQFLGEKRIPYSIQDSRLYIKGNDLFYFTVYSNDACNLFENNTIQNFKRLDENSYSTVKVTATVINDTLVEETELEENGIKYIKLMNRYYEFNYSYFLLTLVLSTLMLCITISTIISDFITYLYKLSQKRKEAKQNQ